MHTLQSQLASTRSTACESLLCLGQQRNMVLSGEITTNVPQELAEFLKEGFRKERAHQVSP
jgi:hypothetical protein